MSKNYYKPGDWNAICDQCGRRFKASELRQRWDKLMVCDEDFEYRHPQDFVRAVPDQQPLPFTRPEPTDGEVSVSYISQVTDAAYAQIPSGTFGDYSPDE